MDGACSDDAVAASRAALQVAAAIPDEKRRHETLGNVLLTQNGDWCEPDPDTVFLPATFDGARPDGMRLVHAALVADEDTAKALSALGIEPISPENRFRAVAQALLSSLTDDPDDSSWNEFWSASRAVGTDNAHAIIVAQELKDDPLYQSFRSECRTKFISRDLPRNPHEYRLVFDCSTGSGPLEVLKLLSDEGRAGYTDALLSLETTYDEWTMRHETQGIYPPLACESPAIAALRQYGRIRCAEGIIPFRDTLGPHPANPAALSALLSHRMAHLSRKSSISRNRWWKLSVRRIRSH